jgi:hypothetical protein
MELNLLFTVWHVEGLYLHRHRAEGEKKTYIYLKINVIKNKVT